MKLSDYIKGTDTVQNKLWAVGKPLHKISYFLSEET